MRAHTLILTGLFTVAASAAIAQTGQKDAGVTSQPPQGQPQQQSQQGQPQQGQPQQGQQGQPQPGVQQPGSMQGPPMQGQQGTTTSQRQGGQSAGQQQASQRMMLLPHELQWTEAPPSLPAGAELAVLNGDPSKEGPFTLRLRFPDGYRVAAHTHPVDENLTVISGTFHIGYGAKFDQTRGTALPAGSFLRLNANMQHYAWAAGETVIQIHANGPWGLTYVNPNDDPTRATSQNQPKQQ